MVEYSGKFDFVVDRGQAVGVETTVPIGEEATTTKTLITGPIPGLGLHTARRLVALGHEVWVMISTYLPTRRRNPP